MYQHWQPANTTPELRKVAAMGVRIFDDTWNTYIPEHKKELCQKIIDTYYFNAIGCESIDRFVFYLNANLRRIMPYYNQLYASELIKFDPMLNHAVTASGRSVENLLKEMKTDSSKNGKLLRDFINSNTNSNNSQVKSDYNGLVTVDNLKETVYNKVGTDDSTTDNTENEIYSEHTNTDFSEDKNRLIHENADTDTKGQSDENTVMNETANKEEAGTRDLSSAKETAHTDTEQGTVSDDGNSSEAGQGTKDWTEGKNETSKTVQVTDLGETTTSSGRKDYADTPQIQLTSSAGSPQLGPTGQNWSVRADYLTNVTWTSDTSKHDLDSTVTTDFTDKTDTEHKEKTSDSRSKTDKNVKTTDMKKDGVGHEGFQENEQTTNSTSAATDRDTSTNKNWQENQHKTSDTSDDTKTTSNTVTDKTGQKDTVGHEVYDDDWTERGDNTVKEHGTTTSVNTTNTNSAAQGQSQGRENESQATASDSRAVENTERTIDTGTTNLTKGFMNVSASALLEAFRRTFINVDAMIIDELADNFMEVY